VGGGFKWAPVDEEGHFHDRRASRIATPRTKMVAITHLSTASARGAVKPVVALRIAALCPQKKTKPFRC